MDVRSVVSGPRERTQSCAVVIGDEVREKVDVLVQVTVAQKPVQYPGVCGFAQPACLDLVGEHPMQQRGERVQVGGVVQQ
jgi:hypothetical protein